MPKQQHVIILERADLVEMIKKITTQGGIVLEDVSIYVEGNQFTDTGVKLTFTINAPVEA